MDCDSIASVFFGPYSQPVADAMNRVPTADTEFNIGKYPSLQGTRGREERLGEPMFQGVNVQADIAEARRA